VKIQRAILILAMILPTLAAWTYFEIFTAPEQVQSLYSFSKIFQFSLPLISFYLYRRKFRWKGPNLRDLGLGTLGGMALAGVLILIEFALHDFSFMKEVGPLIQAKLQGFGAETPARFLVLAIFISLIHSFLEEYYWRWYVHRELHSWLGKWAAVILSSLAFASHHVIIIRAYLPPQILTVGLLAFPIFVFLAGIFWALLYDRHQSIWMNWISHLWADAAILWIGYCLVWPLA